MLDWVGAFLVRRIFNRGVAKAQSTAEHYEVDFVSKKLSGPQRLSALAVKYAQLHQRTTADTPRSRGLACADVRN